MLELLAELEHHSVRFMIIGGHAVNYYTDPRATKDLDIWINPTQENAKNVFQALLAFGAPVTTASPADFCDGKSFFIIGVKPNRVDILQNVPGLEFESAWQNCQKVQIGKLVVRVPGLNDLLKAKITAGRPQDLADVEKLKKVKL